MPSGVHNNHIGRRPSGVCTCKAIRKCAGCVRRKYYLKHSDIIKAQRRTRYQLFKTSLSTSKALNKNKITASKIDEASDKLLAEKLIKHFIEKGWD